MWPTGFAYDFDVVLPPPPPPTGPRSYADVAANHRHGLSQNALPLGNTLGAGFISSSNEEGAVPHL